MNELPLGWLDVELADVAILIRGVSYKKEQSSETPQDGFLPVLRATNITGSSLTFEGLVYVPADNVSKEQILRHGDVVLASSSGSKEIVGKAGAFAQENFVGSFGAFCTGVRPSSELSVEYFGYFFQTPSYRKSVSELSAGSNINNLKSGDLASQRFPLPPRSEQTRIVAKLEELLSDLDAGVAELKTAQKKLQQYRQSLLKAAVEGALTADWREAQRQQGTPTETGAQLLARILTERRARWEARQLAKFKEQGKAPPKDWQKKYPEPVQPDTTDFPALPEGWVWTTAEALFSWGSGDFLPASAQIAGEFPVYGGNGINGSHGETNVDHITIVIGRVGVHCGNVYRTSGAAWITDNAIYATTKHDLVAWEYAELAMLSANLGSGSKGGAQPFISQKILNDTVIALPPPFEQRRICEEYSAAIALSDELAICIEDSLKRANSQRQNILRYAFSGQLIPQDFNDEPANILLERIRADRAKSASKLKPRKTKKFAEA